MNFDLPSRVDLLQGTLDLLRELEQEIANPARNLDAQTTRHKRPLEKQIADGRHVLRELGKKLK